MQLTKRIVPFHQATRPDFSDSRGGKGQRKIHFLTFFRLIVSGEQAVKGHPFNDFSLKVRGK